MSQPSTLPSTSGVAAEAAPARPVHRPTKSMAQPADLPGMPYCTTPCAAAPCGLICPADFTMCTPRYMRKDAAVQQPLDTDIMQTALLQVYQKYQYLSCCGFQSQAQQVTLRLAALKTSLAHLNIPCLGSHQISKRHNRRHCQVSYLGQAAPIKRLPKARCLTDSSS